MVQLADFHKEPGIGQERSQSAPAMMDLDGAPHAPFFPAHGMIFQEPFGHHMKVAEALGLAHGHMADRCAAAGPYYADLGCANASWEGEHLIVFDLLPECRRSSDEPSSLPTMGETGWAEHGGSGARFSKGRKEIVKLLAFSRFKKNL